MLELKNISFTYIDQPVIKELSCVVHQGQNISVIGESGCGKSTLLKLIYGLYDLDSGSISNNGQAILGPKFNLIHGEDYIKDLAQDFDLMPYITVEENVGKYLSNIYRDKKKARVQELLEMVEMTDYAKVKAKYLSGGQQQRVALARVLALEPEILLLDEPFSAIDAPTRQGLYRTLAELRKNLNIPILLVTHDLREADLLADRITVIDRGVGLQTAAPQVLFDRPRNSRVAELVGISNMFEGIFTAGKLSWNGSQRTFEVVDKGKIPPDTPVAWVIPAEGLSLHAEGSVTSIESTVEQISTLGQIAVIQLRTTDGAHAITWEASAAEVKRLALEAGKITHLEIDGGKIHIMPLRPINDPRRFSN